MLIEVLLPLAAAAAAPALVRWLGPRAGWLLALAPAGLAVRFAAALPLAPGEAITSSLEWAPGLGVQLAFRLDGLSAMFALLITGIGALIVVYAAGYMAKDPRLGEFLATLLAFLTAMLGLVLADDLMLLFIFWEGTSISSFLLIGFNHRSGANRGAALQALLVTGGGGLALLAGLLLMSTAGGAMGLAPEVAGRLSGLEAVDLRMSPLYLGILALVLLGAATKSAQVPFHFWLPSAMAAPTPVSAFLHSATMVKAGVYLLARLQPQLGGTLAWEWSVGVLGLVTMLVGAAMALGQHDLKRILAYSTVAVLGILTMLLGIGTDLAVKTAVVFLFAHALYKASLFMVAGNVDHETGTRDVSELGGLRRALPWTAAAGALAAFSQAGAPPMFGFIGKELLYKSQLDLETIGAWLVLAAVLANIALVATAILVGLRPFWGRLRSTPRSPHEAPVEMLVGPVALAVVGLLIGMSPEPFERGLGSAAASAIAGRTVVLDLALWHGLNVDALKALALSVVTLGLGYGLFRLLRRWLHAVAAAVTAAGRFGPARMFDATVARLPGGAGRVTRWVPIGTLRHAILTTFGVTVALVAWAVLGDGRLPPDLGACGVGVHEVLFALLAAAGAVASLLTTSRLAGVAALGATGLAIAFLFMLFGGPDLAMTQIAVETLTVIVLALVFAMLPPTLRRSAGPVRVRDAAVGLLVGATMTWLVLASAGVRPGRELAAFFLRASVPEAFGRNVVNVILVDFRALDTLGEITVVAVAAVGVAALIAAARRARERGEP